jgi:uncharacterized protein (TIGR02001 family)
MAHTKLHSSLRALAAAGMLLVVAPVFSQSAPAAAAAATPEHSFSGNIGVASSYIYRGLNQSNYKPALQAGLDYNHASGFYVGAWASSIKWVKDFGIGSANAEIDLYAGYKGAAGDFGYDVGVLRYEYTSSVAVGATNPDTTELYVAGTYKWAALKYSHAISNTFGVANSKNSSYVDLTATIPVVDNVSAIAHVGYQKIKGTVPKNVGSYTDFKLAGVYDFGSGLTIEGGVTGTDADKNFYTPNGKKFTGKTTPYALLKFTKSF